MENADCMNNFANSMKFHFHKKKKISAQNLQSINLLTLEMRQHSDFFLMLANCCHQLLPLTRKHLEFAWAGQTSQSCAGALPKTWPLILQSKPLIAF